jgi:hypothetical protein
MSDKKQDNNNNKSAFSQTVAYAFFCWISSIISYGNMKYLYENLIFIILMYYVVVIFLMWAFLPEDIIRRWGISYYPDK